jgi:hypothetical protein
MTLVKALHSIYDCEFCCFFVSLLSMLISIMDTLSLLRNLLSLYYILLFESMVVKKIESVTKNKTSQNSLLGKSLYGVVECKLKSGSIASDDFLNITPLL